MRKHRAFEIWVDSEAVVDGKLVSSRKPDDIPAFNRAMVQVFRQSHNTAGNEEKRQTTKA